MLRLVTGRHLLALHPDSVFDSQEVVARCALLAVHRVLVWLDIFPLGLGQELLLNCGAAFDPFFLL